MKAQLNIFNDGKTRIAEVMQHSGLSIVEGLQYIPSYISRVEAQRLWQLVDHNPWLRDLKRRVQHYGYKYDYRARRIDYSMRIGELPPWGVRLALRLCKDGPFAELPDQVIVNEYEPGQGITDHIDCEPCFQSTIVSLSLGSTCVMNLTNKATGHRIPVFLEPGSIVVLKGPSRYDWQHGIPHRKTDMFRNRRYSRTRRISLTFRKVILQDELSCPT